MVIDVHAHIIVPEILREVAPMSRGDHLSIG